MILEPEYGTDEYHLKLTTYISADMSLLAAAALIEQALAFDRRPPAEPGQPRA